VISSLQLLCNVFITAISLPQSTAEVERTFSRLNNNKNKLRNRLSLCTFEATVKSSENFLGDFEVNQTLVHLHGKARKTYFDNLKILKLLMLSLMRLSPCELQTAGDLYGIMLKIYCERCWQILEDIEI